MDAEDGDDIDLSRFANLPTLNPAEAAWFAGVAIEAYQQFMQGVGKENVGSVRLDELLRIAFNLLGQKQSQVMMLRLQLATALTREKELLEALEAKLADNDLPVRAAKVTVEAKGMAKKAKKIKKPEKPTEKIKKIPKEKKKKNRLDFFP